MLISGCFSHKEEKKNTSETKDQSALIEGSKKIVPQPDSPPIKKPESPLAQEWKAIWTSKNNLESLKAFKNKHGVYMETSNPMGPDSILIAEGPCGETFMSLVKNSKPF